jgi:hypothetical protein
MSELGPVVDLDDTTDEQWGEYYAPEESSDEDSTTWNDPEATWVLDIGKRAAHADEARIEVHRQWKIFKKKMIANAAHFEDELLLAEVEKVFSTSKAAEFFGRSTQWMYWGMRPDPKTGETPFAYKDGTPILPERVGSMGKRRFTLPIIKEIALCCYRRGSFSEDELATIMEKILLAEFGKSAFSHRR